MKAFLKTTTLIFLICSDAERLRAQTNLAEFEFGISGGVFVYDGDLTPSRLGSYRTLKPVINLNVTRIITPMFAARTTLSFGSLKGDDSKYRVPEYRQQRNFKFTSPVFEFSELVVADLFKNNMSRERSSWSPYLFAGAGLSVLKIKRDWSRFNAEYFSGEQSTIQGLAADVQHHLPRTIAVLPAGVGVRYVVSRKISVTAETSYRFSFTDYLDGFSRAADPSMRDSYQSHTIGIVYQFVKNNSSWKCPVPKY